MKIHTLSSPDGRLQAQIECDEQIWWSLYRKGNPIIERSPLGLIIDNVDLACNAESDAPVHGEISEEYATRGHHNRARNHCNTLQIRLTSYGSEWTLESRLFDDGFAFRVVVPGEGTRRVNAEYSSWTLPAATRVWLAERPNDWKLKSYAGWWMSADVEALPEISSEGPIQAPPLVLELPQGGFAAISEAALNNYSGMRLRAVGERRVQSDFTEGEPGFEVEGEIVTPWRVTWACESLEGLVNSDLLTNLNPPPDSGLYPDTSYIRPGRCVWRWWSSGTGTPEQERQFVEYAAELGFEFSLVDDGWKDWPDSWHELAQICAFARSREVGILVWKDYKGVASPENNFAHLREWLDCVQNAGVSGVKIDFMDAESKDRIDFQSAALHETARRQLMLFFHGCQKPSGEVRTFPHEITREGIRGLELNKMGEGPITAAHNAALPFTRFITGHGDYTPVGYSNPGPTTWAHQLATAVIFTSPLQVIAEHPEMLLRDAATQPALDLLKRLPTVWDETRVLAPSKIGEVAIFARRKGDSWFLAVLNAETPTHLPPLDFSFLGEARYNACGLSSPQPNQFEKFEWTNIGADFHCPLFLSSGDGFVAVFDPA